MRLRLTCATLSCVLMASAAAAQAPTTRELERINWMEFREVVPKRIDTVLVPLGTLEPHGVTANGADIIAPQAIARAIASRTNALIAPVIPTALPVRWTRIPARSRSPKRSTAPYVKAVLLGLAKNHFKNIILINGHGGPQTAVLNALGVEVGRETASARSSSTGGATVPTSRWRSSARTGGTQARTRTPSCSRSIRRSSTRSAIPGRT